MKTIKFIEVIIFILFFTTKSFSQNECEGAFLPVFQKLHINTDKQYLEKLKYVYDAISQSDLNTRKSLSGNLSIPDFGTQEFQSNKSKIESLNQKHHEEIDYSLAFDEKHILNSTISRTEDVQASIIAWQECIRIRYSVPRLELVGHSDSIVTARCTMISLYRTAKDSVLITNVSCVNLEPIEKIIGRKLSYGTTYTFTFRRRNLNKAHIAIDLSEGLLFPLVVNEIKKDPVYKTVDVKQEIEFRIEADISRNWLDVINPDGTRQNRCTFGNQGSGDYSITFPV